MWSFKKSLTDCFSFLASYTQKASQNIIKKKQESASFFQWQLFGLGTGFFKNQERSLLCYYCAKKPRIRFFFFEFWTTNQSPNWYFISPSNSPHKTAQKIVSNSTKILFNPRQMPVCSPWENWVLTFRKCNLFQFKGRNMNIQNYESGY